MSARPATVYDVARVAGVSHMTVSRYLRGTVRTKPETAARIDQAVADLGYRVNRTARALASPVPRRLAALVFDLHESGPSQIVQGAAQHAREEGWSFDLVPIVDEREATVTQALASLDPHGLAGVLVIGPTAAIRRALEGQDVKLPVFWVDEDLDPDDAPPLSLNGLGAALATRHLVELGHQRVVHVGGPNGWRASENRERATQSVLRAAGLESDVVARGDWTARSGWAAAQAVLTSRATGVTVANDQMALGLMAGLAASGARVPDDVSIVGFDDIPDAAYLMPALTTVRLDYVDQGKRRLQGLLDQIAGGHETFTPHGGTIELVVRRSTRQL